VSLRALLEVQRTDLAITQAERRSAELPQRATHAAAVARQRDLETETARLAKRLAELQAEIASAERRGDELDREIARLETKLAGASSVRESEALQHEIDARRGERSAADDRGLAAMEESEAAAAQAERVAADSDESRRALADAEAALAAAVGAIDDELESLRSARLTRVDAVPADLLARYEARRVDRPNRVVAEIVGTSCGGCHEELSPSELDELRRAAAEDLVSCPNCSCWLVR
jgi:predicted  nucleic acid-binding Zn-ribbon protein